MYFFQRLLFDASLQVHPEMAESEHLTFKLRCMFETGRLHSKAKVRNLCPRFGTLRSLSLELFCLLTEKHLNFSEYISCINKHVANKE